MPAANALACPAKALADSGWYAAGGGGAGRPLRHKFVQLAVAAAIVDQYGQLVLSRRRPYMRRSVRPAQPLPRSIVGQWDYRIFVP